VTRIDLDVRFEPDTGVLRETARVTVVGRDTHEIVFALQESLVVERCSASDGVVEPHRAGADLRLFVDPPLSGPREFSFEISGMPQRAGQPIVAARSVVLAPQDAWYPAMPSIWANASVTVRTPAGWAAVAAGERRGGGDPRVFRWESANPVRTLALAAAPALIVQAKNAGPLRLRLAAAEGGPKIDDAHAKLATAMAWLSGAFAPYPFDGFTLVFVPGLDRRIHGSGIMIVPVGTSLAGPSEAADLLAPQWFGETFAGDGAWIESFAAWAATVFTRDRALPLPEDVEKLRAAYLAASGFSDVALSRAGWDASETVVRGKGSAAFDMVRLSVGDRHFFDAIRDLIQSPTGSSSSLQDVRTALERRVQRSLVREFSDWFDKTGAPQFETTLRSMPASTGGYRADLTIRQRRSIYALPVDVVFHAAGQEHRETIEVEEETTSVFFVLPFEARRVELDPLGKIFKWPTQARSVPD
jgi:hypothetical protein